MRLSRMEVLSLRLVPVDMMQLSKDRGTGIFSETFAEIGRYISHDTIYYNFLCVTDCNKSSVLLQEGETTSYKWIPESEFIAFVNSNEMIDSQRKRYYDFLVKRGYLWTRIGETQ